MHTLRYGPLFAFLFLLFLPALLSAQDLPSSLPDSGFHLTYADWQPKQTPKPDYLKAVEGKLSNGFAYCVFFTQQFYKHAMRL
ncbi:hypothetical protein [Catalinimonas niigatensis]|uniref:hypothetical protein n=1 Tax=Catalinimonas niigatensis TaxID=1397264 RepID=UPI002666FF8E|nr:hypothetical protein [Catalinimonas niigatensis]WPP49950.1 hypothetical protein PZB72_25130 [Catalinimonas niigatensis]